MLKIKNPRFALLVIAFTFVTQLFAQRHLIGLKGGLSYTNVESSNFTEDNPSNREGHYFAFTYQYNINSLLYVGIDLLNTQHGFGTEISFTDDFGEQIGEVETYQYNFNYFAVPIKFGVHFGSRLHSDINDGIMPSFLSLAENVYPDPMDRDMAITEEIDWAR
ncbi:MAG: hypothetical protein HRT74_09390, partial [Flavobacteriales bacterium]|nr:hypothetical protein [Flavobacteriales bacterium]